MRSVLPVDSVLVRVRQSVRHVLIRVRQAVHVLIRVRQAVHVLVSEANSPPY